MQTTHTAATVYAACLAAAAAAPVEAGADGAPHKVRIATSARGFAVLINTRARLTEYAETVRKNWAAFGGGPKPAELAPVRKPRAQWRAVSVQVWREAIEDRDYTGAAVLADELGARYYSGQGRAAYALVAPEPVPGMPEGFHTARRCDGKWVAFEECTGLSIGCQFRAHGSRKAAQAAALDQWESMGADKRADILKRARDAADVATGADARAQWLREHGAAPVDIPAAPMVDELPQDAPAAPAVSLVAARVDEPAPAAQPDPDAARLAAAHLQRWGVTDPAACVHLPAYAAWRAALDAPTEPAAPEPAAAPDLEILRAQMRACEDAILAAAPARYSNGRYGCDIEAAARARSVPVELKRQRAALRDAVRDAMRAAAEACADPAAPVASLCGDGAPDPRNSPPAPELDGFRPGDAVTVPGRTGGPWRVALLYRRTLPGSDEPLMLARLTDAAGKRLEVGTFQCVAADAGCRDAPRPVPAGLADPCPWRGPDNAAARARVYSVHCRTAIAAAQAAGPALKAGARLRRSVNEAGFPLDSAAMRAGIAAHLRAERAAARFARTGCAAPVSAAALDLEGMRAAHSTAAAALAAIDALHHGPDTRLRLILAEAARIRTAARGMRWPVPEVGARYDAAAAMLETMVSAGPAGCQAHPPADDGHPAALAARMAECTMPAPDPIPPDSVPAALASLRRANGWTLLDLAAALGLEGENRADRIRELERGARRPSGTVRQLLAYILADTGVAAKFVPTMPAPDKDAEFAPKQHDGPP